MMTTRLCYEVDFLSVGKDQDGDAIVLRWGRNEPGFWGYYEPVCNKNSLIEQKVVVIDTGFTSDGERIRYHINTYYKVDTVDLIIITHPDLDHIGGLNYILENMDVKELWIHRPSLHRKGVQVDNGRVTENSKTKRLRECKAKIEEAIGIAKEKGIIIKEPFQGLNFNDENGSILVLAPTKEDYESLLPEFIGEKSLNFSENTKEKVKIPITLYNDEDDLDDKDTTSAVNKSSTVILFCCDNDYSLFTGDSGIETLERAYEYLTRSHNYNYFLNNLKLFQIPHHGSKRNLGPSILNKLFPEWRDYSYISAVISCAKKNDTDVTLKHPHQAVINAFRRRNINVYATAGLNFVHHKNMPGREGWWPAISLVKKPLYYEER